MDKKKIFTEEFMKKFLNSFKEYERKNMSLFDDYNDDDKYLLNEIAKVFASRYDFNIEVARIMVADSLVAQMLLENPVGIHNEDLVSLADNIFDEIWS